MDTITAILVTVHIIISIGLIALVLLNSGKGGGLSDMLGGPGTTGNIGQTLAERNLSRITAIVATLFIITSISLTIISQKQISTQSVLEKVEEKTDSSEPEIPKSD